MFYIYIYMFDVHIIFYVCYQRSRVAPRAHSSFKALSSRDTLGDGIVTGLGCPSNRVWFH